MTTPIENPDPPRDIAQRLMQWMEREGWFDPPPRRFDVPTVDETTRAVLTEDEETDRDRR